MPYIKPERREIVAFQVPREAGELNYLITVIVLEYLSNKGESYQTYCEIEGVLSHVSKELYRRRVSAYEDKKLKENGDVY